MTGGTGPTEAPTGMTGPAGPPTLVGPTGAPPSGGTGATGTSNPPKQPGSELLQKVEAALGKIVTLRVTTAIAEISGGKIQDDDAGLTVSFEETPTDAASTAINLALGDLTATRTAKFVDNADYKKLHDDNVALARQVRSETFDLVQKAVEAVLALRKL